MTLNCESSFIKMGDWPEAANAFEMLSFQVL